MSFSSQRFCGFFDFSHSFLTSTFPVALSTLTYLRICFDHLGHLLKHSFLNTEPLTCLVPWFLPLHPRPHFYPSSPRGHASASCFSPLLRRPASVLGSWARLHALFPRTVLPPCPAHGIASHCTTPITGCGENQLTVRSGCAVGTNLVSL